jgi:hypothetical protein
VSLRLLPWAGEDGKACFLSTDSEGSSFLSRLADNLESVQTGMAEDLLGHVREILAAGPSSEAELRNLVGCLSASLRDMIRVADSRGDRLPSQEGDGDDHDAASRAAQAVIDREIVRPDLTASAHHSS